MAKLLITTQVYENYGDIASPTGSPKAARTMWSATSMSTQSQRL